MDTCRIKQDKKNRQFEFEQKSEQLQALYGAPMWFLGRDLELWLCGIAVGVLIAVLFIL